MVNLTSGLHRYRAVDDAARRANVPAARIETGAPIVQGLPHGAKLYAVGLDLPPDLAIEAWEAIGAFLGKVEAGIQWALGDWWAYGSSKQRYGERKAKAQAIGLGREFGTLMNYGRVARAVPTSLRREVLSWSHHEAIASLEKEGEQKKWLDKAERGRWSVKKLKQAIYDRERRDLADQPDQLAGQKALKHFNEWAKQASQPIITDAFQVDTWWDHVCERDVAACARAARNNAKLWTNISASLQHYLEDRKVQAEAFLPRPINPPEPITVTTEDLPDPEAVQRALENGRARKMREQRADA